MLLKLTPGSWLTLFNYISLREKRNLMEILIRNQSRKKLIPPRELRRLTLRIMRGLLEKQPFQNPEVSILFVDDKKMQDLNSQYRNMDRPTDVLSFPMISEQEPPPTSGEPVPMGDIVISLETASRQAGEAGHSLSKEIALLLVHGYLHLIQYDDREPGERRRMMAEQNRRLRRFEKDGIF